MVADGCGRCGASTVPGARFCHACGVRLGVPVIELDVFGQGPGESSLVEPVDSPSSRLSVLAGLAVVVAIAGLGVLTVGRDSGSAADPAGDNEPSGDGSDESGDEAVAIEAVEPESVLSVVDGDPLIWEPGPELGGAWPLAVVERDGASLLFASTEAPFYGFSRGGLVLWRLDGEGVWVSLGTVIDPSNAITAVTATIDSIVAVGRGVDGAPSVWSSDDGIEWARQALPVEGDEPSVLPTSVVATEEVVVVVGSASSGEGLSLLGDGLAEYSGLPRTQVALGWSLSAGVVWIEGPFGLKLLEVDVADLGISEDEIAQLRGSDGPEDSLVWTSVDGFDWQSTSIEAHWVSAMTVTADGEILIAGDGSGGGRLWASADGAAWVEGPGPSISSLSRWGDELIAVRGNSTGLLAVSADGDRWDSIQISDILPADRRWWPSPLMASERAVAVVVQGRPLSAEERAPGTAALLKDGYELVVTDGYQLTLRADGVELVQLRQGASPGQRGYESNLAEEMVAVIDPVTGERLVEFTFDELRQLESMADSVPDIDQSFLILYSRDAENWRISALSEADGDSTSYQMVPLLQAANNQLITAIATYGTGAPLRRSDATVQVFTAPLP